MAAITGPRVSANLAPYRDLVQRTLAAEHFAAFQLAFLRPFAVPRMADTLVRAGAVLDNAQLRAYRTGLQMYEVIEGELTTPRARAVISHINRSHAGRHISQDDFTYVLDSFIVVPIRHIDTFGWRRTTSSDREATVIFYRELGRRMAIQDLPESYEHAAARFDSYERMNVERSDGTLLLGERTLEVLRSRLPRRVQPYAADLFSAQLNDNVVAASLGLPPCRPALRRSLAAPLKIHGVQTALRHRRRPFFVPGQPARVYPNGYELSDIL